MGRWLMVEKCFGIAYHSLKCNEKLITPKYCSVKRITNETQLHLFVFSLPTLLCTRAFGVAGVFFKIKNIKCSSCEVCERVHRWSPNAVARHRCEKSVLIHLSCLSYFIENALFHSATVFATLLLFSLIVRRFSFLQRKDRQCCCCSSCCWRLVVVWANAIWIKFVFGFVLIALCCNRVEAG